MPNSKQNLIALIPTMSPAEVSTFNLSEDEFGTVLAINSYGDGSGKTTNEIKEIFDAVDNWEDLATVLSELNEAPFAVSIADGGGKPSGSRPGRP